MFKNSYIVYPIIILFTGMFIYLIMIGNKDFQQKSSHEIRYELCSDDGLWGRFEWDDVNFFGRYTSVKKFIRDVYLIHTPSIIRSNIDSLPFRICISGSFNHHTILKIYVDDELVETLDGREFYSEWMLSEDCWRSNS